MKYALLLGEDGRILSATYERYAVPGMLTVAQLPEGKVTDYRYADGVFVYDPLPQPESQPSPREDLDAMLVDHEYRLTLLELGLAE